MKHEVIPCIKIKAKDILDRPEMFLYRLDPSTATFSKDRTSEFRDIFLVYDHGNCGDKDYLPTDVWDMIEAKIKETGTDFCTIWLADEE